MSEVPPVRARSALSVGVAAVLLGVRTVERARNSPICQVYINDFRSRPRRGRPDTVLTLGTFALPIVLFRAHSKLRTRTALGPYSRALPRSIGPP